MGIPGSKENLEQLVAIYGYNIKDFGWQDTNYRSMCYASGVIINCNEKKYILTTRDRFIYCQDIVMYHSYYRKEEPIMRHNLDIIYQSIEHNIIILVSKGCLELDLTKGELVNDQNIPKTLTNGYHILGDSFPVPTKKTNLYLIKSAINFEPDIIFQTQIHDVQFIKSIVDEYKYLPRTLMYYFSLKIEPDILNGSVIINRRQHLIGIVSRSNDGYLYVIPMKIIRKIVNDFIYYENQPEKYSYPITLPFGYYVHDKTALIHKKYIVDTDNGKKHLKANDQIISVSKSDIIIKQNDINVYDSELKIPIPFDIYLNMNFKIGDMVNIIFERDGKKINLTIRTTAFIIFPKISSSDIYFPNYTIPYININGLIIVELTHELMDLLVMKKIMVRNYLVDNLMHEEANSESVLMIIDCLNSDLALTWNLPRLEAHTKQKIHAPFVFAINGISVSSLADITSHNFAAHDLDMEIGLEKDMTRLINI